MSPAPSHRYLSDTTPRCRCCSPNGPGSLSSPDVVAQAPGASQAVALPTPGCPSCAEGGYGWLVSTSASGPAGPEVVAFERPTPGTYLVCAVAPSSVQVTAGVVAPALGVNANRSATIQPNQDYGYCNETHAGFVLRYDLPAAGPPPAARHRRLGSSSGSARLGAP
ncbi:hypothetical protein HYH03_007416 [Edaphochlamys debaryana]|uniref:Uncharacterized protein n=1 Tax=Edaphochlamys debaryana TaxID=47281 RepID=A0A835YB81_9CHLO|nr:hypothetical protein HYH03_007416 [Edaphochlamys debaryana]|eukprot:KAG2494359.1 hypothetical protein HYH03_007416 [Edaphochlamys debaryana]